ncbi:MAG: PEP-CTERM sorting domain-containing protein [Sedimentisphaerales bacterium]|jgi:hypothetical protein
MSHTRFTVLVLFAIIAALSVTPANATLLGTVYIDNHTNGLSDQGTVWGGGLSGLTGYTGVYSWTNEGGTGAGIAVPNWGFCTELTQGTYDGWQDVVSLDAAPVPPEYGTPMGMTKANYIRELWGRDFDPSWITGQNRQMAEAFNACIWEIVYETDTDPVTGKVIWDVTSGSGFYATGIEDWATANLWLSQLDGTGPLANNLAATSSPYGQDFIVQIPEPATLSLLAFGAAALLRRRKD